MTRSPLLGRYRTTPVELFRINSSPKVNLRDYKKQMAKGSGSFDLHLSEDGLVHPKTGDFSKVRRG
jgi:hypothetical protein